MTTVDRTIRTERHRISTLRRAHRLGLPLATYTRQTQDANRTIDQLKRSRTR